MNNLSFGALYIEAWSRARGGGDDVLLGPATGFLMGIPGDYWLITARHVVTGKRSDNSASLRTDGLHPDYLRVRFASEGDNKFEALEVVYELYDDDLGLDARWRGHQDSRVDIAALRIGAVPHGAVDAFLPNMWPTLRNLVRAEHSTALDGDAQADADLPLRITDRLYVLGFPFGNTGSWPFAVWTAAPVASEPLAGWDGLPGFLLDSRTREGQSGSPVVLHIKPNESVVIGDDVYVHDSSVTALVGVYCGRIDPRADLGMVWTAQALFTVVPEIAPPGWPTETSP
ncbi:MULTISPECIES: serine protease [unclassified Streptomyces]|uniref:S1 family peptidase n=1 Tax=unclassified Streptomyces TaxID=2593676 RepID=UPI000DC213CA|nr:serine protease [Streptomyces sp. PsTaAH-137]RAJ76985.1 trypsin-like peptidase [Streptomyces sp. PsTaAH-137]